MRRPDIRAGFSFFARARAARSFISVEMAVSDFVSTLRKTGTIKPPSTATATPISVCLKRRMRSPAQTAFAAGTSLQRQRQRADNEIVERELECRIAVAVFGRGAIGFFAQGGEAVDSNVSGEIEMRDSLLGLLQARGDGPAHSVERDFLVARRIVERLDLIGAHSFRGRHERCASFGSRR